MKNNIVISVEVARLGYVKGSRNLRVMVTRGITEPNGVRFSNRFYDTSVSRAALLCSGLATKPKEPQ